MFFRSIYFCVLLFITLSCTARNIKVSLFYSHNIREVLVAPVSGNYIVIADSVNTYQLDDEDILKIVRVNDSVYVRSLKTEYGTFEKLVIKGQGTDNVIKVRPLISPVVIRSYNDDLEISIELDRLMIINNVNIENYVAGVVEAEGGPKAHPEYYKSQALLCRTFALMNIERHLPEGFNLCDEVHCQAYKGRCRNNKLILEATRSTAGQVIIDRDSVLITAAFHSNCGGQTVNSEHVWLTSKSYLRSVKDPWCVNSRNAHWEKTITVNQWKKYLKAYGMNIGENIYPGNSFSYKCNTRQLYYRYGNDSIRFKTIRDDWSLRSTFFSIETRGNNLVFRGRGYGHGVGLCQEGAMQMAKQGKGYKDIIKFYYKDVKIVNIEELPDLRISNDD